MTSSVAGADLHLEVVARTEVALDVVELELVGRADGSAELPAWEPGAHIEISLPGGIQRQYSLLGGRGDERSWRIAVLREHDGRGGSAYIHDHVVVGSVLGVRGPRYHFRLMPA